MRDPLGTALSPAKSLTIHIAAGDPACGTCSHLQLRNQSSGLRSFRHRLARCLHAPIEAALVLHEAQPEMNLALHSGDAAEHCDTAAVLGIPLFDKRDRDLEPQLAWIKASTPAPTTCCRRGES